MFSVFQLFKAMLFNKIPNNMLSDKDQKGLMVFAKKDKIQANILIEKAIDKIQPDQYVKYYVYNKTKAGFAGHALLIRKNRDGSFTYFDANSGAMTYKSKIELIGRINQDFNHYHANHQFKNICFMDAAKMLPPKPEVAPHQGQRLR